jgi:hypothetical protein
VTGIDTGVYNGAPAYRVIFKNGEEIYIDVHGTVLAVQLPSSVQSESTKTNDNE